MEVAAIILIREGLEMMALIRTRDHQGVKAMIQAPEVRELKAATGMNAGAIGDEDLQAV